ncbi:serine/threonine-protein kinase [Paraliomyxa miuraensis]|uniref:serine/threonine-protein kinase n=1 Tax=Paraliomyxa miuraensis TaxID=376150 RepID=UPI0022500ABC|nr:serine/threonine-protein kinase [Paraliomyxa miuraensis]MCX4241227.1 serine/threonine-protein kinase [Paraliomyxa miuraensis]
MPAPRSRAEPSRGPRTGSDVPCIEPESSTLTLEAAVAMDADVSGSRTECDRLGRFLILDTLGSGGMGVVREAHDHTLDRTVALKVLHPGAAQQHRTRLLREAQALARLSHPNVVQVYEIGTVGDDTFIAMELVRGQTLRDWACERRSWRQTVEVYLQAGEGLAAAHAEGLVHRDFKPDNCIIGDNGRVRVLDFGLAREVELSSREDRSGLEDTDALDEVPWSDSLLGEPLTAAGAVLGTVAYMPYEQLQGHAADALSDQFSFCASLYEALYGMRAFSGQSAFSLMTALRHNRIRPAPPHVKVPRRLRRALVRGLSADPRARWPSMRALLDELRALLPRHRWWRTPLLLAVGVGLGGGLLALWGPRTDVCDRPEAGLYDAWSPEDREKLERVFLRYGSIESPHGLRERVTGRLDAYVADWTAMAQDSCHATFVTQQQSEQLFDRRMRCLERRRNHLRSTIDALTESSDRAQLVQRSILAFKLPVLEPCADLDALIEQPIIVEPVEDRDRLAELRQRIDRAHTLREAGALHRGLELAKSARREAEALGDPLLRAEALECMGRLQAESAYALDAVQTLSEAVLLASRISANEVEARAWLSMLYAMTIDRSLTAAKSRMLAVRAAVERTGDRVLQAWWLNNVGILYAETGQRRQARDYLRRALELKSRTLGEDHVDVGITWLNVGTLLVNDGELRGAHDAFERARAIFEATVGDEHPLMAYVDAGRCRVDTGLGSYDAAIERCGRAMLRFESTPQSDANEYRVRTVMARALWGAGRYAEARAMAQRARWLSGSVGPEEERELLEWIDEHDEPVDGGPHRSERE